MDDRNPMPFDQVQKKLASPATLAASLASMSDAFGAAFEDWEEETRLAYVGVVVRHAELGVSPTAATPPKT